jgi:hypothetical protein
MGGSVSSAESLRAAEQSLTARSSEKQLVFSRAFERLARLIVAIRDTVDPADVTARVRWSDPASRSLASEADWAVKMYGANLISRRAVLEKLGWDAASIDTELAQIDHDASNARDLVVGRYMSGQTDN